MKLLGQPVRAASGLLVPVPHPGLLVCENSVASKRPVLVIGWMARIVVTVARSLHRHGIPVDVANLLSWPHPKSRAIREYKHFPRPDLDATGFLSQVRDFIQRGGHDMVIPADDQALAALTEHYYDLTDLAHLACPPPDITRLVLNKCSSLQLAQKCGLRIPKTMLVSHSDQLFDSLSEFSFPLVVKPARKDVRMEEAKSITLRTTNEVQARFPSPGPFSIPMLLQEYCAGAGVGIEMLMHQGECLAVFQHRRLKEFPYTGGVSVAAVSEQPNPGLVAKSLALLRALKWEGPAMVEFKVHAQDGSAVFMEVNGRYWGTLSLPAQAGIDFPFYHWQVLHGEVPCVPENYAVGMKWRWTAAHIGRFHGLLWASQHSSAARRELLRSLVQLPTLFNPSVRDAIFMFSDPMPAILELTRSLKDVWSYDTKALLRRL